MRTTTGLDATFAWRQLLLFVASSASLLRAAYAQGSGPPRGMEALFWAFLAVAAVFVLVVSTILYLVGKKALFKDREASRMEKLALFVLSILMSCAAGIAFMLVFDIR